MISYTPENSNMQQFLLLLKIKYKLEVAKAVNQSQKSKIKSNYYALRDFVSDLPQTLQVFKNENSEGKNFFYQYIFCVSKSILQYIKSNKIIDGTNETILEAPIKIAKNCEKIQDCSTDARKKELARRNKVLSLEFVKNFEQYFGSNTQFGE